MLQKRHTINQYLCNDKKHHFSTNYSTIQLTCQPYNYNFLHDFVLKYSYRTNEEVTMNVSERIINIRERCGLTQNGLAEKAGVSQTHLRRVELGQADITVGHLQLICDALEISVKDFFNVNDEAEELSVAMANLTPKQKRLLIEFLKSI